MASKHHYQAFHTRCKASLLPRTPSIAPVKSSELVAEALVVAPAELRSMEPTELVHEVAKHKISKDEQSQFGYPTPGEQTPTNKYVMDHVYFADSKKVKEAQTQSWDYIVIGSGCTGLAFTQRILKNNPNASLLLLERGDFYLPDHFQNLPLPFKFTLGGPSETFPFSLSEETFQSEYQFMHGSCPFVGGRSCFWSAWSPVPPKELMRGFPQKLIETATKKPNFWKDAKELLHVLPANKIDDQVFNKKFQTEIYEYLTAGLKKIRDADYVEHAPLSVGNKHSVVRFNKFSTPGPLFEVYEHQKDLHDKGLGGEMVMVHNCVVERLHHDESGTVTKIKTSRGDFKVGSQTKVALCMGAFPASTLLMNSFSHVSPNQGVNAHFLTHINARTHRKNFKHLPAEGLTIAAHYLAGTAKINNEKGKDEKYQYHIQITVIASPNPGQEAIDAARECPDYAAAATPQQLQGSEDYVLFVCATLGETDEYNPKNYMRKNKSHDVTTNVDLQLLPGKVESKLWEAMDEATYDAIKIMANGGDIEYWHEGAGGEGVWKSEKPAEIHVPGLVHEASTAKMSDTKEEGGVVGPDYRPFGVNNVYVTGAALFPTSGSWNPTLTMCGFAQDAADIASKK